MDAVRRLLEACQNHISKLNDDMINAFNVRENQERLDEAKREYAKSQSIPKRNRDNEPGFIYLMRNGRDKTIKIGFSKKPKAREETLQSQEPNLKIIKTFEGTIRIEKELHLMFAAKRKRGEWFSLNRREVLHFDDSVAAAKYTVEEKL